MSYIATGLLIASVAGAVVNPGGFRASYKRRGGLRFIRLGRLSLSFCITK